MRITLGGFDLAVAKQPLDFIQGSAVVDQKTGIAVPQVMHPYVG